MKRILFLSALFFVLAVQVGLEQIPQTISYQGVLTEIWAIIAEALPALNAKPI